MDRDADLDRQARRLLIAAALTAHATRRLGRRVVACGPADLLLLARHLSEEIGRIERAYRFRCDPAYPGLSGGPGLVAGATATWTARLLLACAVVDPDETPLGIAFTTLISGRQPQVSVAPAGTPIPAMWAPLDGAS